MDLKEYLKTFSEFLQQMETGQIVKLCDAIFHCYVQQRTVFICGNGGSAANSSHLCEDLGKCSLAADQFDNDNINRLRVMSLTDNTPYILAWGNDEGFDRIFVEQLKNFAQPGDLLIAISSSGNSENVLKAVEWANSSQLTTWGITGKSGGRLRSQAQQTLHVPFDEVGLVESAHLLAFHWIIDDLFAVFNPGIRS